MKKNNLKILVTGLAILATFIFSGCARQGMNDSMDTGMGTKMEETMVPMKEQKTEKTMPAMTNQEVDETMGRMKGDIPEDEMDGMQEGEMNPEEKTMMK